MPDAIFIGLREVVVALSIAALIYGAKRLTNAIRALLAGNNAIKEGLRLIIKQQIIMAHTFVIKRHGELDERVAQQLLEEYKAYKGLGGNGMGDKLMRDLETATGYPFYTHIQQEQEREREKRK
jgi:uncharacterized protein YktA (UPF0223 family)